MSGATIIYVLLNLRFGVLVNQRDLCWLQKEDGISNCALRRHDSQARLRYAVSI